MKTEFLKALGLEQDVIDKIMAENGRDVEAQKAQITGLTGERDGLKSQLGDVAKKLEAFSGVDLDAMKKEIDTLKGDMSKKETEFQAQIADRDFRASVNAEILAAKGKNPKAVMALLDLDALKGSKNQTADIAAALKALAKSDAYLFGEAGRTATTTATVSTGGAHDESGGGTAPSTNAQMNALITGKLRGD
jgi:hypothetical protein